MPRKKADPEGKPAEPVHRPELVVITGLSGSGKGSVLKALEDLGFYAVDNLPVDEVKQLCKADVVIACLGEELPEDTSHKTIWLRSEPEAASKKDFSIYRYDRAGLLMALKSAGGSK